MPYDLQGWQKDFHNYKTSLKMSLKIVRLLIIIISLQFKELLQNEIQIWWSRKNIKQNQDFFKENLIGRKMLKWDQDHDLLWKLANQDPIILARLPHWSSNWRRLKISDNYQGSDSYKNESFCSEDDMVSEGSEDHINENQSQQEV